MQISVISFRLNDMRDGRTPNASNMFASIEWKSAWINGSPEERSCMNNSANATKSRIENDNLIINIKVVKRDKYLNKSPQNLVKVR